MRDRFGDLGIGLGIWGIGDWCVGIWGLVLGFGDGFGDWGVWGFGGGIWGSVLGFGDGFWDSVIGDLMVWGVAWGFGHWFWEPVIDLAIDVGQWGLVLGFGGALGFGDLLANLRDGSLNLVIVRGIRWLSDLGPGVGIWGSIV